MEILLTSTYAPFTAALFGLAVLALIELLGLVVSGMGVSTWIEMALDVDSFPETTLTNWLFIKQLPLSLVLMLAFGGFGITGFSLQALLVAVQGSPAPFYLSGPLALVGSFLFCNGMGRLLAPLFKTETDAVSEDSLLGRVGILLSPRAEQGYAGEVRVLDEHSNTHYLMVEPSEADVRFKEGDEVQLLSRKGSLFLAQSVSPRA